MVRGTVPLLLLGFDYMKQSTTVIHSAAVLALITFALGIYATLTIKETHNRDMDFLE
jgi:hypothetical protein